VSNPKEAYWGMPFGKPVSIHIKFQGLLFRIILQTHNRDSKHCRRAATRYDAGAVGRLAFIILAAIQGMTDHDAAR
jgi:hypothetical protein